jgi:protein-tyrosine phosphatase
LTVQRVLFVCLGNICRSPLAEGIFRRLVADADLDGSITIDSAGTGDWHVGLPPDERARDCARARGVDITGLRARQFERADFERFDRILVMDDKNHRDVLRLSPGKEAQGKVRFLLDYVDAPPDRNVPDPYFGGRRGFDEVFDLIESACANLLADLRRQNT